MTGLLVLVGTVYAFQRASVEATRRELTQSSQEVVAIIEDTVAQAQQRPGAMVELFRLLEGEQLGGILSRIRRTAGSSILAFGAVGPEGQMGSNHALFDRITVNTERVAAGESQFVRSTSNELVLITRVVTPGLLQFTWHVW